MNIIIKKNKKGFSLMETLLVLGSASAFTIATFVTYSSVSNYLQQKKTKDILDEIIMVTDEVVNNSSGTDIDLRAINMETIDYKLSDFVKNQLKKDNDIKSYNLLPSGEIISVGYVCDDNKNCFASVSVSPYKGAIKNELTPKCISILHEYKLNYTISLSGVSGVPKYENLTNSDINDWCDYYWQYGYTILASKMPYLGN